MPTKIEWAQEVLNVMSGCTKVSEGCVRCFAEPLAKRLQAMGQPNYVNGFKPTFHPKVLEKINPRQKPKLYFVCSMGDLFHPDIQWTDVNNLWWKIRDCEQHHFMVLTKRPAEMLGFLHCHAEFCLSGAELTPWPLPNVALGISAENQARLKERLKDLKECSAAYRFLSLEPLLGPIDLAAADMDWHRYIDLVIVGGESGPGARMMNPDWVRNIRDDCINHDVPFMFKQWGKYGLLPYKLPNGEDLMQKLGKKKAGRVLDGEIYDGKINWRA